MFSMEINTRTLRDFIGTQGVVEIDEMGKTDMGMPFVDIGIDTTAGYQVYRLMLVCDTVYIRLVETRGSGCFRSRSWLYAEPAAIGGLIKYVLVLTDYSVKIVESE